MNARRRLHDKWQDLHLNADNETSGDGSLMNDDESDFVNDLDADPQQLDTNDLQACLGHESVQAMLMKHQVDSCGEMLGHQPEANSHINNHLENMPKENNIRLQLALPHHLQQHQQQLQHEHQHVYSLTSL